jgi:hypothetical protein
MSQPAPRQRKRAVKLFYCGKHFYAKNAYKEWMPISDTVANHYLIRGGFRGFKYDGHMTVATDHLLTIRERDCVTFAGPIAGQRAGLLCYNGVRMLVTSAPKLPIAKKGGWPLWQEILGEQLGDKLPLVLEWHRQAYLRVFNCGGPLLPALAVAGETGTGKSLMADILTRGLLGGRVANPVRYMMGQTTFNANVCGSETLLLDDVPSRMQKDALDSFQGQLKSMIAAPFDSLHVKGKDALDVPVLRAVFIAMNQEPHNFRILPLDDTDLDDKLMLLRVLRRPACLPQSSDYEAQLKLGKALEKEIPYVLWHLLHDFKCPKDQLWHRGQACFRDPFLIAKSREDDPVSRVLWLFDQLAAKMQADGTIFPARPKTATEWDRLLRDELGNEAGSVLDNGRNPLSLGHQLRSAAKRFPARVQLDKEESHGGVSKWTVKAGA